MKAIIIGNSMNDIPNSIKIKGLDSVFCLIHLWVLLGYKINFYTNTFFANVTNVIKTTKSNDYLN